MAPNRINEVVLNLNFNVETITCAILWPLLPEESDNTMSGYILSMGGPGGNQTVNTASVNALLYQWTCTERYVLLW